MAAFRPSTALRRAVVVFLPGRRAEGQIAYEAGRAIRKGLSNIPHFAMRMARAQVSTFGRGIDHLGHWHVGCGSVPTGLATHPLVAVAVGIPPIGRERIAEETERSPVVIVAPRGPAEFILIRFMRSEINHPSGVHLGVHHMEDQVITKAGISGDSVDVQRGIEHPESPQLRGNR